MSKLRPITISQKKLKEILFYNPKTGEFIWKVDRGLCVKAGDLAGTKNLQGYWIIQYDRKLYRGHNLAWYYMHGEWIPIDHRDLNRLNNRIKNLRPATKSQNEANKRGKVRYKLLKGVHKIHKSTKYRAAIKIEGKYIHLGCFDTIELAHASYRQAAKKHFGKYARFE